MLKGGVFGFDTWRFDTDTGCLCLDYSLDAELRFREVLRFPAPRRQLSEQEATVLDRLFRLLHLIAGVSYYKAHCADQLQYPRLTDSEAEFLTSLYLQGLGEFAYVNDLDLRDRVVFKGDKAPKSASALKLPRRSLVAIGGGKDSLVSIELLKQAGETPALFVLGASPLIAQVAEETGLQLIRVKRTLSPTLFELNKAGAYNGHVPVTAIVSLVALCCAVMYGYDRVVMSNERSADSGNLTLPGGFEVNHQYSKSFAFELQLSALLRNEVVRGVDYLSLLRPLTEAGVTARFAKLTQYHSVFSSCNRNFHIHGSRNEGRWCCECPKCRFVFLGLAPFMPREDLVRIFGSDLLDDLSQQAGFSALLGIGDHKPFECVGEIDESCALMAALQNQSAWRDAAIVKCFEGQLGESPPLESLLTPRGAHQVPPDLYQWLDAPV